MNIALRPIETAKGNIYSFPEFEAVTPRAKDTFKRVIAKASAHEKPAATISHDLKGSLEIILKRLSDDALCHEEWFDDMDISDVDVCSRDEMERLLVTAPSSFMQGMIYGKFTMRLQWAVITGRDFQAVTASHSEACAAVIKKIDEKFQGLRDSFSMWVDRLEESDPDYCPRAELESLLKDAPTSLAEGYLAGKLMMRIQLSSITGRPFV
jgi:hypothetical protein